MYKSLKKIFAIFLAFIPHLLITSSAAQPDYLINLTNDQFINGKVYEFDVFIRGLDNPFELTSYQCSFTFNNSIVNGGSLTFSYISGTSGIGNSPSIGIGLNTSDGAQELTFASMPGSDNITSTALRVGRFRLQNTNTFSGTNFNILWNFEGNITTILTGSNFTNITVPSNHISEAVGVPVKLQLIQVTASDTASIYNGPEKTIDGLGYSGGDANSIWRAQPNPQYLIYDLGYQQMVSLTRFSFYGFNSGRVYQYSIFLSNDKINWTEVVSNVSSGSNEWTENQFTPQQARYVQLLSISSSENNWATIWEAEIWGYASPTPVELVSFAADVINNEVRLSWSTASETNNKGFEIHRSIDEINTVIGFVGGKGSSSEVNNYNFTDESGLQPGIYSYRLKQIDYDGTSEYSDEVTVEIVEQLKEYTLLQNYPNPFNPVTKIRFHLPEDADVELTVYNSIGEQVTNLVNGRLTSGRHEIEFNAKDFASGIYFYQLNTGNYTDIKKMIVMK